MIAKQFFVQAHRGMGDLAPENCLDSFRQAWRIGCIPECDARPTKDGVIICLHDETLQRTAGPDAPDAPVSQLTWDEIKDIPVGYGFGPEYAHVRVPRLVDVLTELRGKDRELYVDLKGVDLERLARLFDEYDCASRVIACSASYDELRALKRLAPAVRIMTWIPGFQDAVVEGHLATLREQKFADLDHAQLHVRIREEGDDVKTEPSPDFIAHLGRELKKAGLSLQVFPMPISQRAVTLLAELGAESFATDDPKNCRRWLDHAAFRQRNTI